MDWPLQDSVIHRNFGYNDKGKPVLGMTFRGEGEILAAGNGEIIFSRSENDNASRLPSVFGAWTAIDHGDGLISVYGKYNDEGKTQPSYVNQGERIGSAGISGWSQYTGLYFILYDRMERRWVNSSMVIAPFQDTVQPQILGIQLLNQNGRLLEPAQFRGLSQGRYTIMIHATDTLLDQKEELLAPNRIMCSVNGTETGLLLFETICARDGILLVNRNGLTPASKVYAPWPYWELGEMYLNRGQAILEILVNDITGNSRNSIFRMTVE